MDGSHVISNTIEAIFCARSKNRCLRLPIREKRLCDVYVTTGEFGLRSEQPVLANR